MNTKLLLLATAALTAAPGFADDPRKLAPEAEPRPSLDLRPPALLRSVPFLGVATSPVPPMLAAQLGLPEGFGLVVDEVMPDGPAAEAGVLRFDVLRLFNDQQLTEPGQLAALVRAAGKDTDLSLTLLRKGQEQKVSLKITERPMPERGAFPPPAGDWQKSLDLLTEGVGDKAKRLQAQARDYERRLREYHELLKKWQAEAGAVLPKLPDFPPPMPPAAILREVRPGGAAQVRLLEPNRLVTYNTANAKVIVKDDSGEIEVTSKDSRRMLLAKNGKGEVVFDGPIDTPEQIKALPEELRKKVEVIETRTQAEDGEPGGMWMSAFQKMQDAEKLAAKAAVAEAIQAYLQADVMLKNLRTQYPRWQVQIVEQRQRTLADALKKLETQSEASGKH